MLNITLWGLQRPPLLFSRPPLPLDSSGVQDILSTWLPKTNEEASTPLRKTHAREMFVTGIPEQRTRDLPWGSGAWQGSTPGESEMAHCTPPNAPHHLAPASLPPFPGWSFYFRSRLPGTLLGEHRSCY